MVVVNESTIDILPAASGRVSRACRADSTVPENFEEMNAQNV